MSFGLLELGWLSWLMPVRLKLLFRENMAVESKRLAPCVLTFF
jgi:hypothetical protein